MGFGGSGNTSEENMPLAQVSVLDLSALDRAAAASALDASLGENGVVFVRMTEVQRVAKDRSVSPVEPTATDRTDRLTTMDRDRGPAPGAVPDSLSSPLAR